MSKFSISTTENHSLAMLSNWNTEFESPKHDKRTNQRTSERNEGRAETATGDCNDMEIGNES